MAGLRFEMRFADESARERWEAAAAERGYETLAEFVRGCVEAELADPLRVEARPEPSPRAVAAPAPRIAVELIAGGKSSYEPDWKPKAKK